MANEVSCASGREPWSSGYEWQLMSKKVVELIFFIIMIIFMNISILIGHYFYSDQTMWVHREVTKCKGLWFCFKSYII